MSNLLIYVSNFVVCSLVQDGYRILPSFKLNNWHLKQWFAAINRRRSIIDCYCFCRFTADIERHLVPYRSGSPNQQPMSEHITMSQLQVSAPDVVKELDLVDKAWPASVTPSPKVTSTPNQAERFNLLQLSVLAELASILCLRLILKDFRS